MRKELTIESDTLERGHISVHIGEGDKSRRGNIRKQIKQVTNQRRDIREQIREDDRLQRMTNQRGGILEHRLERTTNQKRHIRVQIRKSEKPGLIRESD